MTRTLIAAALFAIGIVPAAHAAGDAPKGIAVAYGDLDLGTVAGKSELKARLEGAAAKLCTPVLTPPDSEWTAREHMVVYRACIGRLSERAMDQIKRDHS